MRLFSSALLAAAVLAGPSHGFADRRPLAVGIDGQRASRNAMGLANVGYLPVLTWSNPNLTNLEFQSLIPIFGTHPEEMGMYAESFTHTHGSGKVDGRDARIVSLLTGDPTIEMASASELSLRVHGPDMVVLTGKSPIRNTRENRDSDFRWVQVYSRASGEWQLVVSQATRLPTTS